MKINGMLVAPNLSDMRIIAYPQASIFALGSNVINIFVPAIRLAPAT
jgi:hypothetical protein